MAQGYGVTLRAHQAIELAAKGCVETRGRSPRLKLGSRRLPLKLGCKAAVETKGAQRPLKARSKPSPRNDTLNLGLVLFSSMAQGYGVTLRAHQAIELAAKGCVETRGRSPRMKLGSRRLPLKLGCKAAVETKGAQRPLKARSDPGPRNDTLNLG